MQLKVVSQIKNIRMSLYLLLPPTYHPPPTQANMPSFVCGCTITKEKIRFSNLIKSGVNTANKVTGPMFVRGLGRCHRTASPNVGWSKPKYWKSSCSITTECQMI